MYVVHVDVASTFIICILSSPCIYIYMYMEIHVHSTLGHRGKKEK